jgi:hypothetical protein
VGLALFRFFLRQFTYAMALTGTAEDEQPDRQRETGFAKVKSHNAWAQ